MNRYPSLFILVVALSILLTGCGESGAWSRAKDANSIESFKAYLQEYPAGEYAADAKERIREIKWSSSSSAMEAEQIEAYLQEYPTAPNLEEAKKLLEQCHQLDEIRKLPEHMAAFLAGRDGALLESVNGLNYKNTINLPRAGMFVSGFGTSKSKWIVLEDPATKISLTFYYQSGDGPYGDFLIKQAESVRADQGSVLVFKNGHRYVYADEAWNKQ